MAQFDSGVFGFLRGKIGTIVSRLRYGKVYVSAKPLKYNTKSDKVKTTRKVFSRRQRLNHELRKHEYIRSFWKAVESEGLNENTKLMIRNKPFISYDRLLPGCGFTPLGNDKVLVRNISIGEKDSTFEFKLERDNPKLLEPPYDVFCIFIVDRMFQNTVDGLMREKTIIGDINFVTIEKEPEDSFIPVKITQQYQMVQHKYYAEKAYFMVAAIKFNELKNKYEWSDTYFEELFDFIPEDKRIKWLENKYKFED